MEALNETFATRKPVKLQTYKGKEFLNVTFQIRLANLEIQFYVLQNKKKHQSKRRRTIQSNFQNEYVEVFHP